MRVFACSLLSAAAQAAYGRAVAHLVRTSGGLLRPIPGESAHLTHAFVSHAPDERVPPLMQAIEAVAARHRRFVIRLGPPFILTGGSEARLICAPVTEGASAVASLAADCVGELAKVLGGNAVSGSRSQHVTLARFRRARGAARRAGSRPRSRKSRRMRNTWSGSS